jgi:Fic family protein
MLLRAEGLASSNIEGVRAPVAQVVAAELGVGGGPAGWVADNLAAVAVGLRDPSQDLTVETLNSWHRRLMGRSQLPPELVGRLRQSQNWIGGRSPLEAAFVPPPAQHVAGLLDDLVSYANRCDLDPVLHAAVLHAQFETIHPYGDGNGRIGRVLVLWLLARRLEVAVPPPMSTLIARDIGGYLSGLHWYRSGEPARWVRWFAGTLERSATGALDWIDEANRVLGGWRRRVSDLRADATGRRLVELLPRHPVISAEVVSKELNVSLTAARTALEALGRRGIVSDYSRASAGPGRPVRMWTADELVSLVSAWGG